MMFWEPRRERLLCREVERRVAVGYEAREGGFVMRVGEAHIVAGPRLDDVCFVLTRILLTGFYRLD